MQDRDLFEELSKERKELQEKGLLPKWFTTQGWQAFKGKYLHKDNWYDQIDLICDTVGKYCPLEEKEYLVGRWKDLINNNHAYLSTPVLSNTGTDRGQSVSCAGNYVGDNVHSFYDSLTENAVLSQHSFGTSSYLGAVRGRGSPYKGSNKNKANGLMPVIKNFVQMTEDISQGSRRGAWAGYLEADHKDFDEIVTYVRKNMDTINIGWILTDDFLNRIKSGDDEAKRRWRSILNLRMLSGKGYMVFIDKVNKQNPEQYKKNNLSVKASNLCVAPETRVLTKDGNKQIQMLCDTWVEIWNGQEWSEVYVTKTGEDQKLIQVVTASGDRIDCTPYHKFYRKNSVGFIEECRASELRVGDELETFSRPDFPADRITHVVARVDDLNRVDDTYCFTEPKRNKAVFNGILTGQCSEITLHSDEEHTFSCILSGMVASTYDEWKDTDAVYCMTIFLDCLTSLFLDQAKSIKGMERIVRGTEGGRAIGLGVSGLHSLFQKKGFAFGDLQSTWLNKELVEHLEKESLRASKYLAEKLGEPEWCRGSGVRNTHRTTLAPNVTSSLIFGSESQGITPWYANVYQEASAHGGLARVNPEFIKLLKKYEKYNDDILDKVLEDNGSCQSLDFLSEQEKLVFRTAFEIPQEDILRLAADRQKHICQSQSLNLFFAEDEKEERISYIHALAYVDPHIKSLYYVRSKAGVKPNVGCTSCES